MKSLYFSSDKDEHQTVFPFNVIPSIREQIMLHDVFDVI